MSVTPSDRDETSLASERLLNSVTPVLSAELANILAQIRVTFEAEADVRLKQALLEREAEFRVQLEAEQLRVGTETTARVKAEVISEVESGFARTLEDKTAALTERFTGEAAAMSERFAQESAALTERLSGEAQTAASAWEDEKKKLIDETNRWRLLAEYQQKVGEGSSQLEILRRFLKTALAFSTSSAVYLNKQDGLALWKSDGEDGAFPQVVSEGTIDPEWYFSRIVVRGKTVAAVGAANPSDRDALVIMSDALNRAVENFGLRARFPVVADNDPTLAPPVPQPAPELPPNAKSDPRPLARGIVSEIKLHHEKQVLEGRVNSDLYRRLRNEIDHGRGEYSKQLSSRPDQDYFHEEIVKILAEGVMSRLGSDYPGPVDSR